MIVRLVLWRLDERTPSLDALRAGLEQLEPLPAPGAYLVDESAERLGAVLFGEAEEPVPAQLDELRALVGREPDLYEEFDVL